MKTRDLTPAERQELDAAHNRYIAEVSDAANNRQAIELGGAAWKRYCDYMDQHDIAVTLAGYRKRVK